MTRTVILPMAGLFLCGLGGVLLNAAERKVFKLFGIMISYLGGSVMLLNVCSFQMCIALFICGIGVAVLLGTGHSDLNDVSPSAPKKETLAFRLILFLMLAILAYTVTERIRLWIPVRRTVLFLSVWIILMDLISLSMDDDLLFRCINLQSICLAFTISYVYMENSVLVFAFFAVINLMTAFGSSVLTLGYDTDLPGKSEAEQ